MKRTLVALALILVGTSAASAQGYGNRHYGGPGYNPHGPVFVRPVPRPMFVPPRYHRFHGYHSYDRHPRFWRPWHRPIW